MTRTRETTESTESQFDRSYSTGSISDPVLAFGRPSKTQPIKHLVDFMTASTELLLSMRLLLQLYGLGTAGSFASAVTTFSQPLVAPLDGRLSSSTYGALNGGELETATIISMIVVGLIGYGIRQLLDLIESKTVIEYER